MGTGNANEPKCLVHDKQTLSVYCTRCHVFGCDECRHGRHAQTKPLKETLTLWTAEISDSLKQIHGCSYAFDQVESSITTMRGLLHDLYYSHDAQIYFDAFEELVPYIRHQALLLKHGQETIATYAVFMQSLLNARPQNLQKIADFWRYWKLLERTAVIDDDIEAYMLRLNSLEKLIQSKEDIKVIPGFRAMKRTMVLMNFRLMHRYASVLCKVEDNANGFSWKVHVYMPAVKAILQYDNIPPQIAYMLRILVNGTIYMCGNRPSMDPTNALLTVPLVKNEARVMFNKKPTPKFIYTPTLSQVLNRYVLLMGGETYETCQHMQCYDIVQDRWMVFPCPKTCMIDKVVMVYSERWVYIRFSEACPVFTLDMLDIENGWVEASPVKTKDRRRFLYVTADGRMFGSPLDRKYRQNTLGEVTIKGYVYKEDMAKKGIISAYNVLTGKSQDYYYAIIQYL